MAYRPSPNPNFYQYTNGPPGHPSQSQAPVGHTLNPFALGGWHNPSNPNYPGDLRLPFRPTSDGPTVGVLPAVAQVSQPQPETISFVFTSFRPDVLNCKVKGEGNRTYFRIETPIPERTIIFKDVEPYALIHWAGSSNPGSRAGSSSSGEESRPLPPLVQTTNNSIARQPAGDFLKVSEDGRVRTMFVHNQRYAWVPRDSGLYLYSAGAHEPKQLVRISSSQEQDGSPRIVLRIANEALPLGLLEPCILAAALMYSGRRFD